MRCIFRTNKVTPYVCSYLFHFGIQAKMPLWMSSKPCFLYCNDFTKSPPGRMPLGIFSGLKYPRTSIRSPEGWAWGWSTFRALCEIACRPSNRLCGIVFCVHSTPFPLIRNSMKQMEILDAICSVQYIVLLWSALFWLCHQFLLIHVIRSPIFFG